MNSIDENQIIPASRDYGTSDARMPPLREQVYSYLKRLLNEGALKPGAFLDLNALGKDLGLSRTPLRDALLRLEAEGFVTIHPRRGVVINPLDLQTIRNAYQILGAIEAAAIMEVAPSFAKADAERMLDLNGRMRTALDRNDFDDYYTTNLAFHDSYIQRSANAEMKRWTKILKDRLYDFPRRESYLSQWERESVQEHEALARHLLAGEFKEAAAFARDVHWSFSVQERYIMAYYFAREAALGPLL